MKCILIVLHQCAPSHPHWPTNDDGVRSLLLYHYCPISTTRLHSCEHESREGIQRAARAQLIPLINLHSLNLRCDHVQGFALARSAHSAVHRGRANGCTSPLCATEMTCSPVAPEANLSPPSPHSRKDDFSRHFCRVH